MTSPRTPVPPAPGPDSSSPGAAPLPPLQPEALFAAAFGDSPIGMSISSLEGQLLRVNAAYCDMFGFGSEQELRGRHFRNRVHPDDRYQAMWAHAELLSGRQRVVKYERRSLHRDGREVWTEVSASLVRGPDGEPQHVLAQLLDVSERRQRQQALLDAEERLRLLGRATNDIVWDWDIRAGELRWNAAMETMLGYPPQKVLPSLAWWEERLHPEDRARVCEGLERALQGESSSWTDEYRFQRADGSFAAVLDRGYFLREPGGAAVRGIGAMMDLSERLAAEERLRKSEEQFRQAQKMEAVGRLAGGVAHDFNNLLTIITAHTDFAREDAAAGSQARADLDVVADTAQRAVRLTRQLLAFSRRQVLQPALLDLNAKVRGLQGMLRRLLGEDVAFSTELSDGSAPVWADPGQVDQVLMNLVVNARDAMPHGGVLSVETAQVELASGAARPGGLAPGPYVVLSVRDTGVGMDAATRARLFEPFFTTKPAGKGTGLGLSTVYGIVQQSGGALEVESAPGQGSTFRVLLPRARALDAGLDLEAPQPGPAPGGSETVLVVEDETPVRVAVCRILERHGYRVLQARHGADALQVLGASPGPVQLVLTDAVMPEMGGAELVRHLRARGHAARVLFMSGYSEEAVSSQGVLVEGVGMIEKPFEMDVLLRRVREVLDA